MPRSLVALLFRALAQARQVFGMTMRLFRPHPCLAVPMFRFRRTGFQPGRRIISPKRGRRVPCPRADRDCDEQGRQAERGHGGPSATGAPCPRSVRLKPLSVSHCQRVGMAPSRSINSTVASSVLPTLSRASRHCPRWLGDRPSALPRSIYGCEKGRCSSPVIWPDRTCRNRR